MHGTTEGFAEVVRLLLRNRGIRPARFERGPLGRNTGSCTALLQAGPGSGPFLMGGASGPLPGPAKVVRLLFAPTGYHVPGEREPVAISPKDLRTCIPKRKEGLGVVGLDAYPHRILINGHILGEGLPNGHIRALPIYEGS